jgi:hypothetical protein
VSFPFYFRLGPLAVHAHWVFENVEVKLNMIGLCSICFSNVISYSNLLKHYETSLTFPETRDLLCAAFINQFF